jgi:zinc transport system ATP-binding protein
MEPVGTPSSHSLEVYLADRLIFFHDGSWLHPLFALDKFLAEKDYETSKFLVKDKIVGKAAALILLYFNVGEIEAQLMSRLAKNLLDINNIPYRYHQLVDRIECKTEALFLDVDDPSEAYMTLKKRIYSKK